MNEVKKYKNMEEMLLKTCLSVGRKPYELHFSADNLIGFKKDHPDAVIPTKAEPGATGYDLYSVEDVTINPGERKLISTGLKWEAIGWDMSIRPRSGMAYKHGITILNAPGSIDASYRNVIGVLLINHSNESYSINKGDRIAQAVFHKAENIIIGELEELSDTVRGEGGFGSTGK